MTDAPLRLTIFLSLLLLFGAAEYFWPRQRIAPQRRRRWVVNLGLAVIGTLCVRLLMPWLAIDAAVWARTREFGILPMLGVPAPVAAIIAFLALDFTVYLQHRLMHRLHLLWRLHRVHHTDLMLDVSSASRFHPLEILLSMAIKIGAVVLLGAAPPVVLAFEIVLNGFAIFTHANIAVPAGFDRTLRLVFVTPDMHRIHHSIRRAEYDSNFGFHVSWWDRLCGTYCPTAAEDQALMPLGLDQFREPAEQRLSALLTEPFREEQTRA